MDEKWKGRPSGMRYYFANILLLFPNNLLMFDFFWCIFRFYFFLLSTNNSARIVKVKNAQKKSKRITQE